LGGGLPSHLCIDLLMETQTGDGTDTKQSGNRIPPLVQEPTPPELLPKQEKMPGSGTAMRSILSDEESSQSIPQKQDSSYSLGPAEGSAFTYDPPEHSEEFPVHKSTSVSRLIPRAPTSSEWSPSKPHHITEQRGSDSDIPRYQEVLRDLDKKAGEQDRQITQALKPGSSKPFFSLPLSWEVLLSIVSACP